MKAYIMVGISGSGKSTKAQELAEDAKAQGLSVEIHSTDNYFVGADGEYRFNPEELSYNHGLNLTAFEQSCEDGVDVVICDNTNLRHVHRWPYIKAALDNGYEVELIEVGDLSPESLRKCASRNVHGLNQGMINAQCRNYQKPRQHLYLPKVF